VGDRSYEADITWTSHGVPHITAADLGSLGFGQGWACSRDHAAAIFDHVLKVRSERARFFGRGDHDRHVHTDLGYLALGVTVRAEAMVAAQEPEARAVVAGYAAGVNAWLAEHGADALPAWCRGAPWVRPIDALDLWRVYVDLAIMGSGRNLVEYVGSAVPPGSDVDEPPPPPPPEPFTADPGLASNGWVFGGDATVTGRGMVFANPHFPWWGEGRFWECHLRVPGELDVYGVSLIGTPMVQMGFNRHIGWSHTFSRGHRFTVYKLDLAEGAATTYRYGAEERAMTPTRHAIEVADGVGGIDTLERTLWSSHYGPMLNLPMLGWSEGIGFTYRDANIDNDRFIPQVLEMNQADGMDAVQTAVSRQGMPWVNTMVADDTGRCWYVDSSTTPALSDEAAERFVHNVRTDPITQLAFGLRVALLDGSDPGFEWQDLPGAPSPGILPYGRLPQIERRDVLFNANDPYWLPHPTVQIEAHQPLCGLYHDHVSARTRINAMLLRGDGPVRPSGPDGRWTADDALAALLGNHSSLAELLLDDVVERLRGSGTVEVDGRTADVGAAAEILAGWNRTFDLDSVGAVLWRELLASFSDEARANKGPLFAEAYDPLDPIDTPRGLAPAPESGPDPVVDAAARAIHALDAAGLAPDVALGDCQYVERGGQRFPLHGGFEVEGVANVIAPLGTLARADLEPGPRLPPPVPGRFERTGLHVGGYPAVYGVSFLMLVSFTDDGPDARGLLVYGQSGDPESPHHADQVAHFVRKELRPLRFTDEAIAADVQEHRVVRAG
jgi:acyl-homoserine-lactone acylase